jgi:hypothetical protein
VNESEKIEKILLVWFPFDPFFLCFFYLQLNFNLTNTFSQCSRKLQIKIENQTDDDYDKRYKEKDLSVQMEKNRDLSFLAFKNRPKSDVLKE